MVESIFKDFGVAASLSLAATGSALGTGAAAMGAIGAWKKCFAQNKTAPFLLAAFVGFPLSQTIYGMILMGQIAQAAAQGHILMGLGIFGGLGMGASAMMQGDGKLHPRAGDHRVGRAFCHGLSAYPDRAVDAVGNFRAVSSSLFSSDIKNFIEETGIAPISSVI
jgi:V/A-type H+-transporting ATPase subunit K